MLTADLINRLLRLTSTFVTRVDLVRLVPESFADLDQVSLGRGKPGEWAAPDGIGITMSPVEIVATGDSVAMAWVVSSDSEVLATGRIEKPERIVPRMVVTVPGIRIEIGAGN